MEKLAIAKLKTLASLTSTLEGGPGDSANRFDSLKALVSLDNLSVKAFVALAILEILKKLDLKVFITCLKTELAKKLKSLEAKFDTLDTEHIGLGTESLSTFVAVVALATFVSLNAFYANTLVSK